MTHQPSGLQLNSDLISTQKEAKHNSRAMIPAIRGIFARIKGICLVAAGLLLTLICNSVQAQTLQPGWTQLSPGAGPAARNTQAMAYDEAHGQVVMFGGFGSGGVNGYLNDTWLWNGTTWTNATPATITATNNPSPRSNEQMVYDPAIGSVVLFGGLSTNASTRLADTWIWNGSTWSQLTTSNSPTGGRASASMVYDAATSNVILFGGLNSNGSNQGDTWIFNGTDWSQVSPSSSPSARNSYAMAYDPAAGNVVLFGGSGGSGDLNDTWTWDGGNWTLASVSTPPGSRDTAGIDYDAALGEVVMFGGQNPSISSSLNDTWVWDGMNWTNVTPSPVTPTNNPAARFAEGSFVYDPAQNQVILFGGADFYNGGGNFGDMWAFGTPQFFGGINVCPGGNSTPAPCSNTLSLTYTFANLTNLGGLQFLTQGTQNLDFSQASGNTCTGTIQAGHSCTLNVTFAPTVAGVRMGAVNIYDNGVPANLLVSTPIYGIGEAPLATFSPLTTFVQNTGSFNLLSPDGVVVDSSGNLFVADAGIPQVLKVAAGGTQSVGGSFVSPRGLAVDGAGNLYVADPGSNSPYGEVVQVPPNCASRTCENVVYNPAPHPAPVGVAVDGLGNLYVADNPLGIVKIPAGCIVTSSSSTCQSTIGSGFSQPTGVAVDGSGNVFVSDSGLHQIVKIPAGCTSSACQSSVGFGWSSPQSVKLDAAGDVIVADSGPGHDEVVEVPAGCNAQSCQIVLAYPSMLSLANNFQPMDAVPDSQGNFYIADVANERVDTIIPGIQAFNFADTSAGNQSGDSPLSVLFQNIGNQALAATGLVFTNPSFSQTSDSGNPNNPAACDPPFSLAPGSACTLSVDFFPESNGTVTGFANFYDNSINNPASVQSFPFTGTGTAFGTEFTLTLTEPGTGSGSVADNFGSINCSDSNSVVTGTCSATYVSGTPVTLTAAGTGFAGWGGDCSSFGTSPQCTLTMNSAMMVTATFGTPSFGNMNVCTFGGPVPCNTTMPVKFNFTATSTTVASEIVVTQGVSGLDFTLANTAGSNCAGSTWTAGTSCTVLVTFAPTAPGLRTGAVELLDSGGNLLATQLISGMGEAPEIVYGPAFNGTTILSGPSLENVLTTPNATNPRGMTTDVLGNLYIADPSNGRLLKRAPNGTTTTVGTLSFPQGVAIDGAGNLFVADTGLREVVEIPAGCVSAACQVPVYNPSSANPVAVVVDGLGDLFIADPSAGGVVEVPTGCISSSCYVPIGSGWHTVNALAIDAAGDLFVPDSFGGTLSKMPAGCITNSCRVAVAPGWTAPQGVAVDAAGDIFVSDNTAAGGLGQVTEVTAGCVSNACEIALATGTPASSVFVYDLAVDQQGQVYAADGGNHRVLQIFQSQPPAESFATTNVGSTSSDSPQSFTLLNAGNQTLSSVLPGFAATGPNFYQVSGSGSPADCLSSFSLVPGAGCNVSLSFMPQVGGSLNGTATAKDNNLNAPSATQTFNLSGTAVGISTNSLTVNLQGSGSGAVTDGALLNCSAGNLTGCSATYPTSTLTVTLTESPTAGSAFIGWSGACAGAGTNPQCVVTMTPTTSVGADFSTESLGSANVCAGGVASGCIAGTFAITLNVPTSSTVSTTSVVTQGASNLDFTLGAGSGCTGFVGPGFCTVNVDFVPTAPGMRVGAVQLLDSSGNLLASQLVYGIGQGAVAGFIQSSSVTVPSIPAGTLQGPKGVLVDAAGDLFVSDYTGPKVIEVGPSTGGNVVVIAQSPNVVQPQGLAMDGAGNLYIADSGIVSGNGGILKVPWGCNAGNSSTCPPQLVPNQLGLTGEFGVSVDAQGDIFVSGYHQGQVGEVPANGGAETVVFTGGSTPIGTAVDPAGDLFVADAIGGSVTEVPAGCISPGCYKHIGSGWTSPQSVSLDAAGDLYVADGASHQEIFEFPAGCITNNCSIIIASPSSVGGSFAPYDAVTDAQGNVYIADYSNQRVDEILQSQAPSLIFGTVNVGARSSDFGVTLENLGNQALTGSVAAPSNANFAEDQVGSTCGNGSPFSISPGGSCFQAIYAQPQSPGVVSGSVTVSDNSNPATQVIPLSVTGQATGFTVTVTGSGAGNGSINSVPTGINCTITAGVASGTCSGNFSGTISLQETPAQGYLFTGWANACANYATQQTCSLTVTSTQGATASFGVAPTNPISVTVLGTGTGSVTSDVGGITCSLANGNVSGTCAANYSSGTQVTLTASATANSIFAGWGGDCASSGGNVTCTLTVNSGLNPIATFVAPGAAHSSSFQPITAGVVYGQGGNFTLSTANNGGTTANSLSNPWGMAFDANGNLYLADRNNNRVLFYPRGSTIATRVYGQNGSFTSTAANNGGISANSLNNPYGVAVDSSGNLYVSDGNNNRVLFYPNGSTTATRVYGQGGSFTSGTANSGGISANSLQGPGGLAVDSSGNLYVAATYRVLFYPNGSTTATRVYGQGGNFNTQTANYNGVSADSLGGGGGIALDSSGDLYIADQLDHRVLFYPNGTTTATRVYGQNGSFTSSTPNNGGISASSLNQPSAVALDASGNLYVAEYLNNRVLFYPFGSTVATRVYGQLASFASNTANDGGISAYSLDQPVGIALDPSGNLYASDIYNNRVLEYGPLGNVNVCPAGQSTPTPCNATYSLSYYAAAQTSFGGAQVVTQGSTGLDFSLAGGTCTGTVNAGNACTVNISFTPLAPGLRTGAVTVFDSSGSNPIASSEFYGIGQAPLAAFGPGAQTILPVNGLNRPSGITIDAAGDLFIADYTNAQIVKVTSSGVQTTIPTSGLSNPRGVAVDGAGNIFISDAGNNRVVEIPAGCITAACQVTLPTSGLSISQGGLAVDGAGDVFIADTGNARVVEITPNGIQTTVPATGLQGPFGVAVDALGDVFISDTYGNQVVKVTAGGVQTIVPTVGVTAPEGVWVDAAGDLFIADSIPNSRIVEVPAGNGAQITVYTGNAPEGVVTDAAGDILIADTFKSRVVEISQSQVPSLSFALTNTGSVSSPQSVSVQNIGNSALPLTGTLAISSLSPNFATNGSCDAGFTLTPGEMCSESFTFTPQSTGYFTGTANFSDNTLNLNPAVVLQQVNMSGIGGVNGQSVTAAVPNVVGLTQAAAASALTGAGLTSGSISTAPSSIVPAGSVIASNPVAGTQVSLGSAVNLQISNGQTPANTPNPLSLLNNWFVTGDYATGSASFSAPQAGATVSGTINISTSSGPGNPGVPTGADLVDGLLYWATLESSAAPSGTNASFLGYPVAGQQVGNDLPNYTIGGQTGTLRFYRADVNTYFQNAAGGIRTGSGNFAVSFPGGGTNGVLLTQGASLIVIYRVLSPSFPLKAIVIYDGATNPLTSTSQNVQGFYDASGPFINVTTLSVTPGNWIISNSSSIISAGASQDVVPLSAGEAFSTVIVSTPVMNTDNDGILNSWKAGPANGDFHVGQPGYYDVKTGGWVGLPGAKLGEKDLFVQLDYMCGNVLSTGACDPNAENLFPAPDAQGNDPLAMVQQAFQNSGIVLHLQIGNIVPEDTCTDSPGAPCQFPNQAGVIGWKNSLEFSKVWPRNFSSCATGGDCSPRFPYGQKDSYHYVLFGHSLAIPAWNTRYGSLTSINAVAGGNTTIVTTDRGTGVNKCPSRITISGIQGMPSLNGVYNTSSCPDTLTIIIPTPAGVSTWSYPNSTLPEPVIGVTSGTVTSISGYSDLGGSDSAVTLGLWETSGQDMSKKSTVIAGTLFHEIGHTLGLSHGGLYYDSGNYVPTFEANCKPNFQSIMNYLFQLDGVGPASAIAYSNQALVGQTAPAQFSNLLQSSLGSVIALTDGSGNAPTYQTSTWYLPTAPSNTVSAATLHCDGTPLAGDVGYRVTGSVAPITPPWSNGQNITFDGVPYSTLRGYNDIANIDLRQVGATGGEFASLASVLSFATASNPLNIAPGGSVSVAPGGTVTLGGGGSISVPGGNVTIPTGGVISGGGTITLGGGGTVTLGGGGTLTAGSSGVIGFPGGGNVTLGGGGTITLGAGGTLTFVAGDTVTLASGGTITLGGGGSVTIPSTGGSYTFPTGGGTITLGGGGNVTLGAGGNVTLGGGGTITLGGGGNVTLGGGGNVTLGGGGTITLGGGGTVTMGGGGNVTLGGGGTITLGGGGNVTLGGGGNVTLGGGGTVTLGGGGNITLGGGGNVTLGGGGTVTMGAGGTITLGGGGTDISLSSGGTVTMGGGGTITMNSAGNVTLGGGGTITEPNGGGTVTIPSTGGSAFVQAGGTITLGGGGTVTLGGGGNITMGGGGTITLGGGGTITMGGGGNVTLGGGGVVTLGGGGTITLGGGGNITLGGGGNVTLGGGGSTTNELDFGTANSVVRPPTAPIETTTTEGVVVNWTAPGFGVVQTYTIYRSVDGGTPVVIGSVSGQDGSAPATTFTDTNPPSGTLAYTITTTLVPDQGTNTSRQSAPSVPAVVTLDQTLVFSPPLPSSVPMTPSTIQVTAVAESIMSGQTTLSANGQQVSFVATGACSIATQTTAANPYTATVSLNGTGSCNITASQSGDSTTLPTPMPAYNAATPVSGTIMIEPDNSNVTSQTITFPQLPNVQYGSGAVTAVASTTSNAAITFAVTGACNNATANNMINITGAGKCTVTASAPSGSGPNNTTYSAATATQSFHIAPAVLTVTANSFTIPAGQQIPSLTYNITGYVNGDSSAVLNNTVPALSTTATSSSAPGTYPITVSTGSLAAANYDFFYVAGTLTIQQLTATISWSTPPPASAAYGSQFMVLATSNSTGAIIYNVTGGCTDVNHGPTVTMTSSTLACQVSATVAAAGNYASATVGPTSVKATLATPAISWSTSPPASAAYGAQFIVLATSNPTGAITYNATGGCTDTNHGNTVLMISSTLACQVSATVAAAGNYSAATVGPTSVTATQATITVTANNLSRAYGAANPTLTVIYSGFVNGDKSSVLSGSPSVTTTATTTSLPGPYPITVAVGSLHATNYTFNFVNGTLTVTATGSVPSSSTTCNGAYTGTFKGSLVVSKGQTCIFVSGGTTGTITGSGGNLILQSVSIGGGVTITSGGTFSIGPSTTIKGNLTIESLPKSTTTNQICSSTITGSLVFQSNGVPVLIGSSTPSCAGNIIQGSLQVASNSAAVTMEGNTVSGSLQVQSNPGATTIDANKVGVSLQDQSNTGATQVFNNIVTNALQCQSNTTITGGGNTAASKTGQCAKF